MDGRLVKTIYVRDPSPPFRSHGLRSIGSLRLLRAYVYFEHHPAAPLSIQVSCTVS
jgi:hypothetical protein